MDEDSGRPPLARRVPGANLRKRALPPPCPPVLSDAVMQRVQATVEAERASPAPPTEQTGPQHPSPAEAAESGGSTRWRPQSRPRPVKRNRGSEPGS
jgi:hypothetical protein